MKRKGELTTQQLVTLIILIVSFGIILFLIFNLGLGETTNKEICHNSVLLKSKSVVGGVLDCKINYVCISGGGKCEGFNEDYTLDIDMNLKPTEKKTKEDLIKEEIMKAIANEMADCWWMFGEGKVDYVKGIDWSKITGKKVCAICSRIKFDSEIKELGSIDSSFFKKTLIDSKKGGDTYFYYLYGIHDVSKVNFEDIDLGEEYIVLTGVAKKGFFGAAKDIDNWLLTGVDLLNSWIPYFKEHKMADYNDKEYGPLPVTIKKKEDIDKLTCTDFITKA